MCRYPKGLKEQHILVSFKLRICNTTLAYSRVILYVIQERNTTCHIVPVVWQISSSIQNDCCISVSYIFVHFPKHIIIQILYLTFYHLIYGVIQNLRIGVHGGEGTVVFAMETLFKFFWKSYDLKIMYFVSLSPPEQNTNSKKYLNLIHKDFKLQ